MLRHDILARYILSSSLFSAVFQVTIGLELASLTLARTLWLPCSIQNVLTRAWERSSNGSGNHRASRMGCGAGWDARAEPPGYSGYARDRGRVREPAGRWPDPELSRRVLSHHPGFPAVAADVARSVAADGERVLSRQHSGRAPPRRHVARDGRRLQRSQEALPGTRSHVARDEEIPLVPDGHVSQRGLWDGRRGDELRRRRRGAE